MFLKLKREYFTDRTEGRLYDENNTFIAFSMEKAWINNERSISCVPPGFYDLVLVASPKYGRSWHLKNLNVGVGVRDGEAQRSHILIHAANKASELEGCIALGTALGELGGSPAVLHSRKAINKLHSLLPSNEQHKLIIEV